MNVVVVLVILLIKVLTVKLTEVANSVRGKLTVFILTEYVSA